MESVANVDAVSTKRIDTVVDHKLKAPEPEEHITITDRAMQAVATRFDEDPLRAAEMASDLHSAGQSASWQVNEWLLATTVYQEAALRATWVDDDEEALRYLELAVEAAERAQSPADGARALVRLGDQALEMHDIESARDAYTRAVDLSEKASLHRLRARALSNLGATLMHEQQLEGAVSAYREALDIYEKAEDQRSCAKVHFALARIESAGGELESAKAHLDHAQAIQTELGDRRGQARTLASLGALLIQMEDLDGAEEQLELALQLFDSLWDRVSEGDTYQTLSAVALIRKAPQQAIAHLADALNAHAVAGDLLGMGEDLSQMGLVYAHFGHPRRAVAAFECALAAYDVLGADQQLLETLRTQADILLEIHGQTPTALASLRHAEQLSRELDSPAQQELSRRLEQIFEKVAEKDADIAEQLERALDDEERDLRSEGLDELLGSAPLAALYHHLQMLIAESTEELDLFLDALEGQSRAFANAGELPAAVAALLIAEDAVEEVADEEVDNELITGWRDELRAAVEAAEGQSSFDVLRRSASDDAETVRAEALRRLESSLDK